MRKELMKQQDLEKILPHRKPMLLLDEAFIEEDDLAVGSIRIHGDEFFLQGHFPGNPVVPGVILCEMMAQTCAVLLKDRTGDSTPFFTGLDKIKFRGVVRPGDVVEFHCRITKERAPFFFAEGKGFVDSKLCVEGTFSFALIQNTEK